MDIITVGSGTVDVFVETKRKEFRKHQGHEDVCYTIGGKQLISDLTITTGGGGTNCAAAFSRYGLRTGWCGVYGDDANATVLEQMLKQEKIRFLGRQKKGQCGYSVILRGLHHDRCILTYKGINDTLTPRDVSMKALNPRWFYFSSLLGRSFETSRRIVEHARKNRRPWAYNMSSYLAREGMRVLRPMLDGCALLVLNEQEARLLTKKPRASLKTLLTTLGDLCERVVITRGAKGAIACDAERIYHLKATKQRVVETTGAGDAFAAGTICGLVEGKPFGQCLKMGYALASSVITKVGAKNGLLNKRALLARMRKQGVQVREVLR